MKTQTTGEQDMAMVESLLITTDLTDASEIAHLLTPENFLDLLQDGITDGRLDDPSHIQALERFASLSSVEFQETETPEEAWSRTAIRVEQGISGFIEENQPLLGIQTLKEDDVRYISEIYNPTNLLAFAKELARNSYDGSFGDSIDMVYRYRTVIRQLDELSQMISAVQSADSQKAHPKDGHRTWAGDIRRYGDLSGYIDDADYQQFTEADDPGYTRVTVDGEIVKLNGGGRVVSE